MGESQHHAKKRAFFLHEKKGVDQKSSRWLTIDSNHEDKRILQLNIVESKDRRLTDGDTDNIPSMDHVHSERMEC